MQELGKGAFGTVYKGRIKGTEGPWRAIKKIPKASIKDSTSLLNEIEISMELDNPNIVKLYEIYEWNHSVYLVCEYPFHHAAFAREESCSTVSTNRAV